MYLRNPRGLGDNLTDALTNVLPDAYSDTSTLTGLPLIWELGLGGVGLLVLWTLAKRTGRTARRVTKRGLSRAARVL